MSSPEKSTRGRGRPAQLSRQKIVDAALAILQSESADKLTMQNLARRLNSSPMALYTHIKNREDLLQAVAAEVLAGVALESEQQAWDQTVREWSFAVRSRLRQYPAVASLLQEGIGTPAAWLEFSNPLLQALRLAGFSGEALADAQRWISRVVVGSVLMEMILPSSVPAELDGVRAALNKLPPENQSAWLEALPGLGKRNDEEVFAYTLDRCIDGLKALL